MKKIWILAFVFIMASQTFADLRQTNYRWRLDNAAPGNENWAASTNSAITIAPGQKIRLRIGVDNEIDFSGEYHIDIYYSTVKDTNDAVWTKVDDVTNAHFKLDLTNHFSEADVMNNEPNFPNAKTFGGGLFVESDPDRLGTMQSLASMEFEYSIIATANASLNTPYYFIIKPGGGYLNDNRIWDGIVEWAELSISNTVSVPTVSTTAASLIGQTAATLGGNVTAAGGLSVIDRGVVYSTTDDTNPEVWESGITKDRNGTGTGTFSESISPLSPNTTYYYRAYATNSTGTGYGEVLNFTTSNINITLTDGSTYTPIVTPGSSNQALGRFQLTGDIAGASLAAASIKLNSIRTGLSNFKLWSSADATFNSGSDTQLGTTVGADPGDGSSASFSSFSSAIGTSGTYYFLTADVAVGATGHVQGVIVANGNLTLANGTLSGSIDNAPLSNGDVSLPVELASFTASVQGNAVVLNWQTASETDNLGFILERAESNEAWRQIASYRTHDELQGHGNTSTTTAYSFTDLAVTAGREYRYRLGDVNMDGTVTMHSPIAVTMTALPQSTELLNAYPNPFNPETMIKYTLHQNTEVTITVYDLLGRKVKTLIDEQQTAGAYQTTWNGTDEAGAKAASGSYIIRMETADKTQTQKVLLLR